MVRAQLIVTPSRTRPTARRVFSGVRKLSVPSWSSTPQRPQLLNVLKYSRTVSSVGMPCCIVPPPDSRPLATDVHGPASSRGHVPRRDGALHLRRPGGLHGSQRWQGAARDARVDDAPLRQRHAPVPPTTVDARQYSI